MHFLPFVNTNSHLTTKPYNVYIKCQCNSETRTNTVFWDQIWGCSEFVYVGRLFITTETTLLLTGYSLSYLNNHNAVVEQPRVQKSTLGRLGYLQTFWQPSDSESLPIFVPLAWSSILLGTTEESYKKSLIRETLNLLVVALTVVALTKLVITNTH